VAPATALSFAASPDARGRALEHVVETAARTAARGPDALVLIDTLAGLHPHTARKILAFARNLRDGGSLTIVATAAEPVGGETTVIALDPALAAGGGPSLDLIASGTLRAELLVGEEGAAAIAKARSDAIAH
jgi:transcription termination factor Rho